MIEDLEPKEQKEKLEDKINDVADDTYKKLYAKVRNHCLVSLAVEEIMDVFIKYSNKARNRDKFQRECCNTINEFTEKILEELDK